VLRTTRSCAWAGIAVRPTAHKVAIRSNFTNSPLALWQSLPNAPQVMMLHRLAGDATAICTVAAIGA
jgi:hypothetical protein